MTTILDLTKCSTILIVDDEPANVALLERLLRREGFDRLVTTTDPRSAVDLFRTHHPDLVLLDLMMPELDGFALLDAFSRLIDPGAYLPILVLTADVSISTRRRALSLGAKDFIVKPIDAIETILRIFNLLETRFLVLELIEKAGSAPSFPRPRIVD